MPIRTVPAIILSIAVPTPLPGGFDYLPADDCSEQDLQSLAPGVRVKVPFRSRTLVGYLLAVKQSSDVSIEKLKPVLCILDKTPVLTANIFALCQWAANYYHQSIGNVLQHALPVLLREGAAASYQPQRAWQLTTHGNLIRMLWCIIQMPTV